MSQKTLLVEGLDDKAVTVALWNAQKLPESFLVEVGAGKDAILKSLPLYLKNRQAYPVVGVLLDADESLPDTWSAVKGRLGGLGYSVPSPLPDDGMILDHPDRGGPRLGVWLMPDNRSPGMLEDFVSTLIPQGDRLTAQAEDVLDTIESQGLQQYAPQHRIKAHVHTWLAWQEEPGRPMGQAITRKYLDPASDQADAFVSWLRCLFLDQ